MNAALIINIAMKIAYIYIHQVVPSSSKISLIFYRTSDHIARLSIIGNKEMISWKTSFFTRLRLKASDIQELHKLIEAFIIE